MYRRQLLALLLISIFTSHSYGFDSTGGQLPQTFRKGQIQYTLKADPWENGRWNFIDSQTGRRTGAYIERDRWEPDDRLNIYDSEGTPIGEWTRDTFESERWNYNTNSSETDLNN
jgi:hypothetical protein